MIFTSLILLNMNQLIYISFFYNPTSKKIESKIFSNLPAAQIYLWNAYMQYYFDPETAYANWASLLLDNALDDKGWIDIQSVIDRIEPSVTFIGTYSKDKEDTEN